ncbi:uridine 5'-monophosphate synthase-like [Anneissia japonica]|uniref:uridine 5'-monophosphate synthase-like n=1 Tax=Anneissia japonica TaxID=1529436 RepID=UPI00142555EF|nr:uridine 5'-monophosphate synthase-like [Anneissia japonica]
MWNVDTVHCVAAHKHINMEPARKLIVDLFEINALKFGKFTLKSGIESPVYFDLRVIVSYPEIMQKVSELLWHSVGADIEFNHLCGVPYTALPLATCMAVKYNKPMLIRRKEAKDYGTKKMIEGIFGKGDKCLIVEDVVTSGTSVMETAESLNQVGLNVTDAVVLLNREQGGKNMLASNGIRLHSVLTLSQVSRILEEEGKLSTEVVEEVKEFILKNQFQNGDTAVKRKPDNNEESEKKKMKH